VKRKPKLSLTYLHEHNASGQHRIVAVANDSTNSVGNWVDERNLARHLDLFANTDANNGLPMGIFKVREISAQVLA